jgi:hypothetical protein
MSEKKTAAQVGYETYVTIATQEHWIPAHGDPHPVWGDLSACGWRWSRPAYVHGDPLPAWNDLQPMIQDAWSIIATAIIAHWEREYV